MIIGFDFDKVFINYPPFVPDSLVNLFYKRGLLFFISKKKKEKLLYRFPGIFEQKIRIMSHAPIVRKPIKKNIKFLKMIKGENKHKMYLISSRYGFLKTRTETAVKKYKLHQFFFGIYFNYENKQPHIFKEENLIKLKVNMYIDDDLAILIYLSKRLPKVKLYWLSTAPERMKLPHNIEKINCLSDINEL